MLTILMFRPAASFSGGSAGMDVPYRPAASFSGGSAGMCEDSNPRGMND